MAFLGSLGQSLTGSAGIGYAPTWNPTDSTQVNRAYDQSQYGIDAQQRLLQALQAQNGIQNQSQVFSQQQDLANQLQNIGNGQGPNPAQAMLNQQTGNNIQAQSALMAGQRGASANAGLIARQIAHQGSQVQQQAVGQGATMQAQQQLGALQALQGQQNSMGALAGQQVGQQSNAVGNYNQAALGQQSNLLGSQGQYNQQLAYQQNGLNKSHQDMFGGLLQSGSSLIGPAISWLGSGAASAGEGAAAYAGSAEGGSALGAAALAAHGGMIGKGASLTTVGPKSKMGQFFAAKGGQADYRFGGAVGANNPQQAAKVSGNSYKNDKIPAVLSEDEIVIPRSITKGKDAPKKAAAFVAAVLAKKKAS